ncbi:hypothetical protein DL765_004675 [Monosporascus sp. GIB2]|nr:hypothetical protein DL765_004675 [Monosporascus sp. GIB2]
MLSFTASLPLRYFLAVCGAASVQGSILIWCRDHRMHHRYVDTPRDPYNVKKGILWSHMGWLIFKPDPKLVGHVDVSDLHNDPVVVWQHRNFPILCIFMSYALPCIIGGLGWGDGFGGLLYAGIIRTFLFQQSTNCVNSLAHYLGDQPYADGHSSRDHILTALLTFGEGYHNFHHEFPCDYRNGIRWFDYDPTKWSIRFWNRIGLAADLQEFAPNEINKALFQQKQKRLRALEKKIAWGPALETLPTYTWDEFERLASRKVNPLNLICVAGVIYNVKPFLERHPGGRSLLLSYVGKDATASFNGGIYNHTKAARNLLDTMRFGVLRGGTRVESLRKTIRA